MISNDNEYKTFGHIICFDIKLSSKNLCTFSLAVIAIYFLLLTRILCIGARRCLERYGTVC